MSPTGHIAALRQKIREDDISAVVSDSKKYIRFRWNRLFLHSKALVLRKYLLKILRRIFPWRYTDADPFKLVYIDPKEVKYHATNVATSSGLTTGNVGKDWGRVKGGDWKLKPIEQMDRYKLFESRYIGGESWSELQFPEPRGKRRDQLYESMKKEGYRTQWEIDRDPEVDPTLTDKYKKSGVSIDRDVEVGVGITADGEFVFIRDGKNRLCMSKVLELNEIAVQVRVRYSDWQAVRDEIRRADNIEELSETAKQFLDHPDVQDIV